MEPKILITAPVRNRAPQLYSYLEHICKLDYPKRSISIYWIINDSRDSSLAILEKFKKHFGGIDNLYRNITIKEINLSAPFDGRTSVRRKVIYGNLAFLRNKILEHFLTMDNEYLFNIDSDIYVKPDCLKKLLELNKDIVSAEIFNDFNRGDLGNTCKYISDLNHPQNNQYVHYKLREMPNTYRVDLTGACYLIKRKVIEAGTKYSNDPFGEDKPFCEMARAKKFELWAIKGLAVHDMQKLEGEI